MSVRHMIYGLHAGLHVVPGTDNVLNALDDMKGEC